MGCIYLKEAGDMELKLLSMDRKNGISCGKE
jgi:hypothetical protein